MVPRLANYRIAIATLRGCVATAMRQGVAEPNYNYSDRNTLRAHAGKQNLLPSVTRYRDAAAQLQLGRVAEASEVPPPGPTTATLIVPALQLKLRNGLITSVAMAELLLLNQS